MRDGWGDGDGLFAGHRQTVENVKMEKKAFRISAIEAATSQEQCCSTPQNLIFYKNMPTTFLAGASYWKSRIMQLLSQGRADRAHACSEVYRLQDL
jgi:hypothetical protein